MGSPSGSTQSPFNSTDDLGLTSNQMDTQDLPDQAPIAEDSIPRVLLLSLSGSHDDHLEAILSNRCHIDCATDLASATSSLNERPDTVIATDAAITTSENADLVIKLYEYVSHGGALILSSRFSTYALTEGEGNNMDKFFRAFGLGWKTDAYHRTTVQAQYGSARNSQSHLHYPFLCLTGVHLRGIEAEAMLYVALKHASGLKISYDITPFAWKCLGAGFVGYISNVVNDYKTDDVMLAMCGLSDPDVMDE